MDNIERYIESVRIYVNNHPDITEDLLIRYVFLDLANKLSFDIEYLPFGNSKRKQNIYRSVNYYKYVDECLRQRIVICNTASRLLEIVLKRLGVDIDSVQYMDSDFKMIDSKDILDNKQDEFDYTEDEFVGYGRNLEIGNKETKTL